MQILTKLLFCVLVFFVGMNVGMRTPSTARPTPNPTLAQTVGKVYALIPEGRGPYLGRFIGTPVRDENHWTHWTDDKGATHATSALLILDVEKP